MLCGGCLSGGKGIGTVRRKNRMIMVEEGRVMVISPQGFFKGEALVVSFALPLRLDTVGARGFALITLDAPSSASYSFVSCSTG
jgi:hypothetical protein